MQDQHKLLLRLVTLLHSASQQAETCKQGLLAMQVMMLTCSSTSCPRSTSPHPPHVYTLHTPGHHHNTGTHWDISITSSNPEMPSKFSCFDDTLYLTSDNLTYQQETTNNVIRLSINSPTKHNKDQP